LSKLTKAAGNPIAKGELIGYSGNTGNSSAPHLHCERRNNIRWSAGKDLDPAEILGA
jgi:murein DD-endopeptidase MepM/ murein hydrolase activator NlpD